MSYRHVDESRKGDDFVVGYKRLRIDETKAVITGLIGLLTGAMIWDVCNKLSKIGGVTGEVFSYAGLVIGILWGLFAFIETSTIYYSEKPCFSTKSIKLIYVVFFVTFAMTLVLSSGTGIRKLYGIIEVLLGTLILYILYKAIKKKLKKKRRTARQVENV